MNINNELLALQEKCSYLERQRDSAIMDVENSKKHFKEKLASAGRIISLYKTTLMSVLGVIKFSENKTQALSDLEGLIQKVLE